MANSSTLSCTVVRVTRHDTVLIRVHCPPIQSQINMHMVLEGVKVQRKAKSEIIDWVDVHADSDRDNFLTWEWFRDSYGRVLGDLTDPQTGDSLTQWLLSRRVAKPWPDHYLAILRDMVAAEGPEEC